MNPPSRSPQFRPARHDFDEHPAQAGTIEAARPIQLRPVTVRPEETLRLGTPRKDRDMGRPLIVEEDDETQTSGAMDGRHENNPSDGLFNNPSEGDDRLPI